MSNLLQRFGVLGGGTVDLLRVPGSPSLEIVVSPNVGPSCRLTLPADELRDIAAAIGDELPRLASLERKRKAGAK